MSGVSQGVVLLARAVLVCGLISAPTIAGGGSQVRPEVMQLVRIKRQVQRHLLRTQNLTCIETVERTRFAKNGKRRHSDTVRLEVAFTDGKEVFSWPGESEFSHSDIAAMVGGGTVGTGDFLGTARAVFLDSGGGVATRFVGEELVSGRTLVRYDYSVGSLSSGYRVAFSEQKALVEFSGSFWADKESDELVRLTTEATEIPPAIPIKSVLQSIDYGLVKIGKEPIVLPQSAHLQLSLLSGEVNRNRMEFSHWREYKSSSRLSFYDDDVGSVSPSQPAKEVLHQLPPGLRIKTRLSSRIDSNSARVGDEIRAKITSDAKHNKETIVPAGATLTGRIRWLDMQVERCVLGVEFIEIRWDDNLAWFFGRLDAVQDVSGTVHRLRPRTRTMETVDESRGLGGLRPLIRTNTTETFSLLDIPGVALLIIESNPFRLSSGVHMAWITERP